MKSSELKRKMTTRFLGRVPIRQRRPSGPAAMERENKENRLADDDNDKADVVGEDTLLAMLNESKVPDKAVGVAMDFIWSVKIFNRL